MIAAWLPWLVTTVHAGGTLTVLPEQMLVESESTIEVIYTVGPGGFALGDEVRVFDPVLHGYRLSAHSAGDLDPAACSDGVHLVVVEAFGAGTIAFDRNTVSVDSHVEAWTTAWLDSGELVEGDEIVFRFGDTSTDPSCAYTAPIRAYHHVSWPAEEMLASSPEFEPVGNIATIDFTAGAAELAIATAPSVVRSAGVLLVNVAMMDSAGNPDFAWEGEVRLAAEFGGTTRTIGPADRGRVEISVQIVDPGVYRIPVTAISSTGQVFETSTNPIVVEDAPQRFVYWGDIHAHHGNTYLDDEGFYVDENHEYAKYYSNLDVACESMKAPESAEVDYEIYTTELWAELQDTCSALTENGDYVAMLGFEWVSNLVNGNHHNVYYDGCDGPSGEQSLADIGEVYDYVDLVGETGPKSVIIPHATYTRSPDWEDQRSELRTAAEIYSGGWGNSLDGEEGSMDGTVLDGMRRGAQLGFISSSDHHAGFMGNPVPGSGRFGYGGLVAFVTSELSRRDVFEALKRRRTYATTGARIVLDFSVSEGGEEVGMGDVYIADAPQFNWTVAGTDTIESVTLRAIRTDDPEALDFVVYGDEDVASVDHTGSFTWADYDHQFYAVWLQVEQGEHTAWSSPIYLSRDCNSLADDPSGLCDADGDGMFAIGLGGDDCNDDDPTVFFAAPEIWYDGIDSDCDGADDYDRDGDGHRHQDYGGDDCNDLAELIHPSAVEVWYDGVDSDCDGGDDYDQDGDGQQPLWMGGEDCHDLHSWVHAGAFDEPYDGIDADCDGSNDYDQDGDGQLPDWGGGLDCDDEDPDTFRGAVEIWYDGVDGNCDDHDDYDADFDGYTSAMHGGDDCNDIEPSVHPGVFDAPYDGLDADCDGRSDFDADEDGFDSMVYGGVDCDDFDVIVNPLATEIWYDGIDGNCDGADDYDADADGQVVGFVGGRDCDDEDPTIYDGAPEIWYDGIDSDCGMDSDFDADSDGYEARTFGGSDCDDIDPDVNPAADDVPYDGLDADCDGRSDFDADYDGFEAIDYGGLDCVDDDAAIHPFANEAYYDGIDADCDGQSDFDADGDGFDSADYGGGDCNDFDTSVHPDVVEVWYDGVDSNCDGADDYDADGDGQAHTSFGGTDCDDADATVYEGAPDAWYDGVDSNCDQANDYDADKDGVAAVEHGGEDCDDTTFGGLCGAPEPSAGCSTTATWPGAVGMLVGLAAVARRRR